MGLWKDKTRKHWCYSFQYQNETYAGRGFKTKREAVAAREKRRKEEKEKPTQIGMAFSEVVNLYLDYSERRFTDEVYKYKAYVYKTFFKFLKKDFPLDEISTAIVEKYLETRHSNNNFNVHRRELSALFSYSVDTLEALDRNPINKISKMPHTVKEKYIPPEKDIIKILLVADPTTDEKDLLMVLIHTLARIDEALRLTWNDINFKNRVLIKRTRKTRDGAWKKIPVKINDEIYQVLWKRWEKREQDTWVFYNSQTKDRFHNRPKMMKGLCNRAGVSPAFGFHTLRHMMSSLLNDDPKISTKTIQGILGHASQRTTEIYLHQLDGANADAMDSLAGKFSIPQPKLQQLKETGIDKN